MLKQKPGPKLKQRGKCGANRLESMLPLKQKWKDFARKMKM